MISANLRRTTKQPDSFHWPAWRGRALKASTGQTVQARGPSEGGPVSLVSGRRVGGDRTGPRGGYRCGHQVGGEGGQRPVGAELALQRPRVY